MLISLVLRIDNTTEHSCNVCKSGMKSYYSTVFVLNRINRIMFLLMCNLNGTVCGGHEHIYCFQFSRSVCGMITGQGQKQRALQNRP